MLKTESLLRSLIREVASGLQGSLSKADITPLLNPAKNPGPDPMGWTWKKAERNPAYHWSGTDDTWNAEVPDLGQVSISLSRTQKGGGLKKLQTVFVCEAIVNGTASPITMFKVVEEEGDTGEARKSVRDKMLKLFGIVPNI